MPDISFCKFARGKGGAPVREDQNQHCQTGVEPKARVEVELRDSTKVKGYISQVGEDSFVVVDAKKGTTTTVMYPQVRQIKGNHHLSEGAKLAIGIGILIALALVVAVALKQ